MGRMALSKANRPEIEEIGSGRRPQTSESSLPPQLVKDLEEAFKLFDLNGDGKISKAELGTVLRSIGDEMSDADLEQMIRDADTDGDGEVDLQEFINLNSDSVHIGKITLGVDLGGELPTSSSLTEALQSAFNVFDSDKDGFISADSSMLSVT
ncbi:polcalcin Cup a 4 isoform X2 [Physcomitrium patens]|uniref:polcalcin Cup a 4 isoform X2 n=1 Tax=Physcomitrium patens TaxID=3218 RepID=UPI003CCCF651